MSVYPFKPPFSYEELLDKDDEKTYRVRDANDSAVCRTYVEENAKIVTIALNLVAIA